MIIYITTSFFIVKKVCFLLFDVPVGNGTVFVIKCWQRKMWLMYPSCFVQMRVQGVGMAERSIVVWIWVPHVSVGGLGGAIWRPLAEQLWEQAVEKLMTGPAGQNPCRPQLLVNMPAEKTGFRERSATVWLSNPRAYLQNSLGPACDIMRPSGVVPLF